MLKTFSTVTIGLCLIAGAASAQRLHNTDVPATVKEALMKRYPAATHVGWEKEKGNFEANWGGLSKEDTSVTFTPAGAFLETVIAIPVGQLPSAVAAYVKKHYPGAKLSEAGRVTDAAGHLKYEAEVKGKDLLFDDKGNFLGTD
jgi:putative PepSY-like beta-lactamase-inhibitor